MQIYVYWNISDRLFTVRSVETEQIREHTPEVGLRDAEFLVDQAERERMLREGRRNLHAGVQGDEVPLDPEPSGAWERVLYRPWEHSSFVTEDGRGVARAELVRMVVRDGRAHVYARGITR